MHNQDISSRPNSRKRFASAVGALLRHRYLPGLAALLAVLFTLPSLKARWTFDDFYHREVLLGTSRFRDLFGSPDEMFWFFRGDPERTGRGMDIGLPPWWTYPGIKLKYLHVLSVMTFRLDYLLWPDSPALMHAHSLLWFAALVAVIACFYRRMFGPTWLAGVAALLFALNSSPQRGK